MVMKCAEKIFLLFFEDGKIYPLGICCVCCEGGGYQFPTPGGR